MKNIILFIVVLLSLNLVDHPIAAGESTLSDIDILENSVILKGSDWHYSILEYKPSDSDLFELISDDNFLWRKYDPSMMPEDFSNKRYLIIRIPLPKHDLQNPVIVIPALSYQGVFEVYINNRSIYRTTLSINRINRWNQRYYTRQIHVIPLSHKTDSKYLYFLLNSDTYSKPGLSAPLRLSSASKVERQLARHIIEFVSIGFIFFLIALISFVAALHIQADRKKPLSYAVLAITAGLYLLVNADLSRQIIEIPHLLSWYVSMVTFYSFPIGMFAFLEYTLDRPLKQVNRVLWRLHLAFAIIAVSLEALGILEYMFLLPYFLMLLSVSITLNLFLSLPVFFVRGKENGSTSRLNRKIITLGGIIFFSTVTHDILATFRFIHSGRSFFHVGLLVFTLFLAYILLRNYIDADIKLREYSRELTRKSNQLEEYSHNLEEKVRDRTRELQQNIALLEKEISLRAEVESRLIKHETELEKLNATKDRFFSIIAHDLRNPFNSIIGMSHLIVQQSENLGKKEIIDSVQDIHSSSILVYKLLENLLEWSRLQRGVIKPQPENLHVIDYINEALSIHRNMIHNKDINVKLEIEEGIKVYGDGNMLRTILRNLISNAIKFTPRGGSITLASVIDGQNVVLSISDTGAGIPPEVLPRLFDIDRQHTTKGTEKETGSGLGLILCREFIEKMEGSIMVTSEIDEGSVFKILLPAGTEG